MCDFLFKNSCLLLDLCRMKGFYPIVRKLYSNPDHVFVIRECVKLLANFSSPGEGFSSWSDFLSKALTELLVDFDVRGVDDD